MSRLSLITTHTLASAERISELSCRLISVAEIEDSLRRLTAIPDVTDSLGSYAILASKPYSARILALAFDSQRVDFCGLFSLE